MPAEVYIEVVALADEAVWLMQTPWGGVVSAGRSRWRRPPAASGGGSAAQEEPVIVEATLRWEGDRRYACRRIQERRPDSALPGAELFHPPLAPDQGAVLYRALQVL